MSAQRMPWIVASLAAVCSIGMGGNGSAYAQGCDPVQVAKLLPSDGIARDIFGGAVSIDGVTAFIGTGAESVYVFTRNTGVWTEDAKLLASDGGMGQDLFGRSVSINGDTAVVGAPLNNDFGAAYVFTRSGGVWTEEAKLTPIGGGEIFDFFGWSVSIKGDTAVVGASEDNNKPGSAYIFTRNAGVWTQQAKLLASDGAPRDWFGSSVSIDGDTVVIGARSDNTGRGSAYIFTRNAGVWTQQAKLVGSGNRGPGDFFGWSTAIRGDTAVIGELNDDENGSNSGSAYVFTRSAGVWTQQAKLLASDGIAEDKFGSSVSLDGDTVVVGAFGGNNNSSKGSAYLFTRSTGVWTQQAKLLASDGSANDAFGKSVSIDGDTAFIGADADDDNGFASGSAYVFDLGCNNCRADCNGDGFINTQDFICFLNLWTAQDPAADCNGDTIINTLDFTCFLNAWNAGCP